MVFDYCESLADLRHSTKEQERKSTPSTMSLSLSPSGPPQNFNEKVAATPMETPMQPTQHHSQETTEREVRVLRIDKEVENIGERVPMSKKRISWRFVFSDCEQVHTITLEHSRISAKKRLRVDGKRVLSSEQYCSGAWHHKFRLESNYAKEFCVTIKDVKSSVVDHRVLDSSYELNVDGVAWEDLSTRDVPYKQLSTGLNSIPSVWNSAMYARRIGSSQVMMQEPKGRVTSWTFVFGQHGDIHKLEFHELDAQESKDAQVLVLFDLRILVQQLKSELVQDENGWKFSFVSLDHHKLELAVTFPPTEPESQQEEKEESYATHVELIVDGCQWLAIGETDFVLKSGWYPVHSRSRGMNYYRNDETKESLWEKPIVLRNTPQENQNSQGTGTREPDEETAPNRSGALATRVTSSLQGPSDDVNLLVDFFEVAVHASPKAQRAHTQYSAFDPFAPRRGSTTSTQSSSSSPDKDKARSSSVSKASSVPDFLS